MTIENIGYHTRLIRDNTIKICGGSFGGRLDIETVNRLVNVHFDVVIKPSGHPVFVDRKGHEVSLYIAVNPTLTDKGRKAKKEWIAEKNRQDEENERLREAQQDELDLAMFGLSHEEIIRRLKMG